ncbi:hypothetical protein [Endozoicomonas sp. ALD068]|uniref:hypothetical protein n=1 Tax=Endozoicomonas sp. ALD068 TaxID=3403080 RepID=UPI003BB54F8F
MTPVIASFILVIPAKAGIHTDSPPEPYCPVPPTGLVIPEKAEIHRWHWIPAFRACRKTLVPMLLGPVGPSVGTTSWSFATPSIQGSEYYLSALSVR